MVFFYLVPVLFSAMGNWLYADYLNLPDLSYPRINLISLHFFILSSVPLVLRTFLRVIETSWVFYPPLSLNTPGVGLELTVLSLHLNGISRLLGSMNYFCTFFNTGLANFEVYLFSLLASSMLLVLGLPSVIVCLTMVVIDRNLSTHFFNHLEGGNLFMYMHLFWWFGHPEVYVVALPSFGLISSTISVYAHFPNYYESIYSIIMISFIGLSVWAHHMFLDVDWDSRLFYSFMSLLVGLPTGNKVFT
jgi:cytochrome c oxidase subunit 1